MGKGKRRKNNTNDEVDGETTAGDQSKKVMVNGVDIGWHTGNTFLNGLKQFHEKFALQPDRKKVNVIQEILCPALIEKLRETNFRCRIEYTGSSFEGTKVPKADDDPDYEFDMLFIIEGGDQLKKAVDLDPDIPGFAYLEPRDQNIHEHRFEEQLVTRSDERRTLSAAKFLSDFRSVLAKCINEIGTLSEMVAEKGLHRDYLIKLRGHGPAIQMDVYLDTTPNAAASGEEVSGEKEQRDESNDGVTEDATGYDNEQCNRIKNKWEGGMEGEQEERKENYCRDMDEIENTSDDVGEEAICSTEEEESDGTSNEDRFEENGDEGNRQEVCFTFRLATKDVIGRKELSKLKRLYSVDVVPTLHVPSPDHNIKGEYYVAKPVKGHDDRKEELKSAWRHSFSLDAKKKLKSADNENTCKKTVFRILKAIRNRECGLHKMNTYHLKNALFKELDEKDKNEEPKDWSMNMLAERFMDVLERLIAEFAPGQQMSEYFIQEMDLLEHMKEETRENIHWRLKRLRNSEKQMMRILEGKKSKKRRPQKKKKELTNTEQDQEGLYAGI